MKQQEMAPYFLIAGCLSEIFDTLSIQFLTFCDEADNPSQISKIAITIPTAKQPMITRITAGDNPMAIPTGGAAAWSSNVEVTIARISALLTPTGTDQQGDYYCNPNKQQ